ncbi:MAG: hypothetical protein VX278_21720 [Myxococcota bacterium]|nr:hypothetical protein [Myxococcota bacterium]
MMYTILLGALIACSADKNIETEQEVLVEPSDSPEETAELESDPDPPEINSEGVGEGGIFTEEEEAYRNKKRMGVAQVKASMERISGIEWKVANTDMWDKYGSTLGVPDYQQVVTEDLSPSIMFQKFLDDAAIHTCKNWIENEYSGEQRLFFSEIEPGELDAVKTRSNIAALRQQIHGVAIDENEEIVNSLVDLHALVIQRTSDPKSAWKTVCVGLFTHPEFFIY